MRIGRWVGIVGALVYAVGFVLVSLVPGGGDVNASDFEDFYVTDDNTAVPIIGVFVLTIGVMALLWFIFELRNAMHAAPLMAGFAAGVTSLGLGLVAVGGCLLAAPSGVQAFSDEEFVGAPVAHAFAQAGFAVMLIPGALFIGFGVLIFAYSNRRSGLMPGWVTIAAYVAAALQLAAYIWIPSFAFPIWVIIAGLTVRTRAAQAEMGTATGLP